MQLNELFTAIFKSEPASTGNREMLQGILHKHPYFTVAQYYLLKATDAGDTSYEKVAAKAALLFGNPYLLNYRLNAPEPALMKEILQKETPKESKTPGGAKEEMLFEPLFASDYFASQGIKLSEEVLSGDKLGKQLKSFTDWLKTMKKVHELKTAAENTQVDLTVERLAEKSNQEDEVITESMAEAYLQQGKTGKARAVLQKLSLLNPAKSAYFAAKIEKIAEE